MSPASNTCNSHYGLWIHTAALIGYLDPTWLTAENKNYVNTLVKDACNPITDGQFFPFSRAFDWYHGHSWAHGTTPVADGKDQESTSEDANFVYALKMWGKVSGDKSMEARGNLMLSILARSIQTYFLMDSANTAHPPEFIGNKVTGIVSLSFLFSLQRKR
jgi:endo-1,3(4)-beta-glucanase